MTKLKLGSLFDGSGGFPLAGILSGIEPIWASEIEPFPIRVTTKRLPSMKHYGDISRMNGGEVEPVDIITFGSPCQDMSVAAGNREGLGGDRSKLFFEAIRIIKEMRKATDDKYPKYIVWENVTGAFSSNRGNDFRCVLEEIVKIKDETAVIPSADKWTNAGSIVGEGFSIAWRVLDAQYWGVPQRRKRIFLVADFVGGRAGEILFESEGVSGYSAESFRAWQGVANGIKEGVGEASTICLNDQGGSVMDVTENKTGTLRAQTHGHLPTVMMFENHREDARYKGPLEVCTTVVAKYGTGGGNQPFVTEPVTLKIRAGREGGGKGALVQKDKSATLAAHNDQTLFEPKTFGICSKDSNAMKSDNPNSGFYEAETSRTIDRNGGNPSCNQGGVAVVENGAHPVYTTSKSGHHTRTDENVAGTLVSTDYKDPPIVSEDPYYIVRRLTPTECARLQGFPDWWCDDLGDDNPTDDEVKTWMERFETHRKAIGKSKKAKTEKQVRKWLKNPFSDTAAYKMWGNGVALPCVYFVLAGVAHYEKERMEDNEINGRSG